MFRSAMLSLAVLVPSTAFADRFDPPRCRDVTSCVTLAEKTPAEFSPTLNEELEKLSGAVLVEGLKYTHPRPAVNALIREQLREALSKADGHTTKSARTLLELAQGAEDEAVRLAWIDLLARDRAGRPVLVAFIDGPAKGERRLQAMLAYVERAGELTPSDLLAVIKSNDDAKLNAAPVLPREVQPIFARYVDEIWATYLQARSSEESPTRSGLLAHLAERQEYDERFTALLGREVESGRTPAEEEISILGQMAMGDPKVTREMLRWTDTSNAKLRRVVAEHLLLALSDTRFTRDELPRVRKMLITGALDPETSKENSYPYFLKSYLEGLSADEARQVAEVAAREKNSRQRNGDELLVRIADSYPEYREPLMARLVGADLEDAERLIGFGEPPIPWMEAFASNWIQERTAEELRDETLQERFLILTQLLKRDVRNRLRLPKTRRAHFEPGPYRCYTGAVMAYQAAVEERRDLAAFGLPLPEKTPQEQVPEAGRPGHYEENKAPAAAPLTPQEATVRWQQFVMARESVLRHLAKGQKT